jgi:phosphoribosylanthranilate isomerase
MPPTEARALAAYAKGKIPSFVVGLSFSDVEEVADAFDYVQIYEARPINNLVLASKDRPSAGLDCRYFVYDASVGSGVFGPFPEWLKDLSQKLIVAGGLNAGNVCTVIQDLHPFGVDVSSGVEMDGVKDLGLMQKFIEKVRSCS